MWPDDGEPRFIVTSVTGIAIKGEGTYKPRVLPVTYQVLDRAYAHRLVREFLLGNEKGMWRAEQRRVRAEALAADLNAQDAAGLLDEDIAPLYEATA